METDFIMRDIIKALFRGETESVVDLIYKLKDHYEKMLAGTRTVEVDVDVEKVVKEAKPARSCKMVKCQMCGKEFHSAYKSRKFCDDCRKLRSTTKKPKDLAGRIEEIEAKAREEAGEDLSSFAAELARM